MAAKHFRPPPPSTTPTFGLLSSRRHGGLTSLFLALTNPIRELRASWIQSRRSTKRAAL